MSDTPAPAIDNKKESEESFAIIKALVTETELLMPKIADGNKSAARNARNNLNSIKKNITPLRQNILEIVKSFKKSKV